MVKLYTAKILKMLIKDQNNLKNNHKNNLKNKLKKKKTNKRKNDCI